MGEGSRAGRLEVTLTVMLSISFGGYWGLPMEERDDNPVIAPEIGKRFFSRTRNIYGVHSEDFLKMLL